MFTLHALRHSAVRPTVPQWTSSRNFWGWVNMMFNRVDEKRLKLVGPDRLCAEWLLRNGAKVKFLNASHVQEHYNLLPDESVRTLVEELDGTESGIMHIGFDHLKGLKHLRKIKLHKCVYLQNQALAKLILVTDTLEDLEVSSCKNISDHGLLCLKDLKKLKHLVTYELPYVKNLSDVEKQLKQALPECKMNLRP
ncbi:ATP synthase subunit s, mitochondrial-like [Wyeomyia smithii]|uniref:ATP synthase subunit s, mitochondrial-like n=1 Tax=Wyeomyia smithii TaxID=174621 RepID=UPI0024680290|nr:ATP synthase subunit s, mitochondrial-like [Wyeomyia smithii]